MRDDKRLYGCGECAGSRVDNGVSRFWSSGPSCATGRYLSKACRRGASRDEEKHSDLAISGFVVGSSRNVCVCVCVLGVCLRVV